MFYISIIVIAINTLFQSKYTEYENQIKGMK